jgi:hypothetical protein
MVHGSYLGVSITLAIEQALLLYELRTSSAQSFAGPFHCAVHIQHAQSCFIMEAWHFLVLVRQIEVSLTENAGCKVGLASCDFEFLIF